MLKRRMLAFMLSCICLFSTFANAAFADAEQIDALEAVEMLASMDIISGYSDGTYRPNATVTRGEMAKMIYAVRLGSTDGTPYADVPTTFHDIQGHWAAGYIKYCQINGILSGRTSTTFAPNETVTGSEAVKMLLIVLGYTADRAGLTGTSWERNTLGLASESRLLNDMNCDLAAALPRQYAAQLLYNAFDAKCVAWSKDADAFDYLIENGHTRTIGEKYLNLYTSIGTLVTVKNNSLTLHQTSQDLVDSTCQLSTFANLQKDHSNLLGKRVKILTKDGKVNQVMGVYATEGSDFIIVNRTDLEKSHSSLKYDGEYYDIDKSGVSAYINGVFEKKYTLDELINRQSTDKVTFIDSDRDDDFDLALFTTYQVAPISKVSKKSITVAKNDYKFEDHLIDSGLEENDYVVITHDNFADCSKIMKASTETATIDSVMGDKAPYDRYQLDGIWHYRAAENYAMNTVKVNDTVTYIAVNGVVCYAKKQSAVTTTTFSNVVLLMGVEENLSGTQAKLGFMDGSIAMVTVSNHSDVPFEQLKGGNIYEYRVDSHDTYRFTTLSTADDYYNNYTAIDDAVISSWSGSTPSGGKSISKDAYKGVKLASTAKVYLYTHEGKKMTSISANQYTRLYEEEESIIVNSGGIAAFKKIATDKKDKDKVYLMFVAVERLPRDQLEDDHYGYIVSDSTKMSADCLSYTIWTGEKYVSVVEDMNSSKLDEEVRRRGMVIGYEDIDTDGTILNVVIFGAEGDGIYVRPLLSIQNNILTYKIANLPKTYTIGDQTKILYVNSQASQTDEVGQENGNMRTANTIEGFLYANTMFIPNGTSDISLLVIDTQNELDVPALYHDVYTKKISNSKTKATISGADTAKMGDLLTVTIKDTKGATKTITLQNAVFADTRLQTKTITMEAKKEYHYPILANGNGEVKLTLSES